jgi:succinyl-CoA synthetase beta subunit
VSVAEQVAHEREYVLGFERHDQHGALLMFGIGGADLGAELEFRSAPISAAQARALVAGHAESDAEMEALVATLLSLQSIALSHPEFTSVDLNPLAFVAGEVVVLDAKVHLAK